MHGMELLNGDSCNFCVQSGELVRSVSQEKINNAIKELREQRERRRSVEPVCPECAVLQCISASCVACNVDKNM